MNRRIFIQAVAATVAFAAAPFRSVLSARPNGVYKYGSAGDGLLSPAASKFTVASDPRDAKDIWVSIEGLNEDCEVVISTFSVPGTSRHKFAHVNKVITASGDEPALITVRSGKTGRAKCVIYAQQNQVAELNLFL